MSIKKGLHLGDCLELLPQVAEGSVDLVLCDLPYGTTTAQWDEALPLDRLWAEYQRILKPRGAVVLTASQPFTSQLVMSNPEWFRYEWIWVKNRPTNFAHAKNKPMKKHESVLIFSPGTTAHASLSDRRMTYNPQGLVDIAPRQVTKSADEKTEAFFADRPSHKEFTRTKTGYPNSVLEFSTDQLAVHPTAKPLELMRYLVRTYSNPGELVLDNCVGSGTTALAAMAEGRGWIAMERDLKFHAVAEERLAAAEERLADAALA